MPSWEGILTDQQRRDVLAFVTEELVKDRDWQDEEFETLTVLDLDNLAASATPSTPESIKHGSELVVEMKCIECHGLEGRGDGNAFNLKDDWGFPIQPADWHKCWNFRGTRQDPYNVKNIFRTFSTGVNGTPMPSFADNSTIADRWDLANYVGSLCERESEINIDGGKVTDEIAQQLSTGKALPTDILTDKPKANFVVPSKYIEGELPTDEHDERWKTAPRRWIALGGQITHKPRNFVNRIDDAWVQSIYNKDHIQFLFQWDDRTKSVLEGEMEWDPTEVNLEDYGVVEQPPGGTKFEDDPAHPESIAWRQNRYNVYNDGIAFEFPIKWQELPFPRKPRYLWGDEKFAMDINKWTADGTLAAYEGTGWDQDFNERDDMTEKMKLVKAEWKDGRWTVLIQRPIKLDYEEDAYLEAGKYIPMVFFCVGWPQWGCGPEDGGLRVLLLGDGTPDSTRGLYLSRADGDWFSGCGRLGVSPSPESPGRQARDVTQSPARGRETRRRKGVGTNSPPFFIWLKLMKISGISGVLLAGGKSRRMGAR